MTDTDGSGGHSALTDEQTGLPNRLHFDTVLERVFATARRGMPLSIVALELDSSEDWFRNTDPESIARVLGLIRKTLLPIVRQTDLLARVGEGRFAVCLIDCNMAGAVLVADRIDGLMDTVRKSAGVGFSIGGATFDLDMEGPEEMIGAAEGALTVAQSKGGNQMEFRR